MKSHSPSSETHSQARKWPSPHLGLKFSLSLGLSLSLTLFPPLSSASNPTPNWLLPAAQAMPQPAEATQNLLPARAIWLNADYLAWPEAPQPGEQFVLRSDAQAHLLQNEKSPQGAKRLPLKIAGPLASHRDLRRAFPQWQSYTLLQLPKLSAPERQQLLQSQLLLESERHNQRQESALQLAPVLDATSAYNGPLGIHFDTQNHPTLQLWAPTARSVHLLLYGQQNNPDELISAAPQQRLPMQREAQGVWRIQGPATWQGQYYRYEVEVYAPYTGQIEHFQVTDPYSLSLARNSSHSQIINLDDASLRPRGWSTLLQDNAVQKAQPEDMVIYELQVRDFSSADRSVPLRDRGKFTAFTHRDSQGMRHLRQLAQAGLSHVHLLPVFDLATIPEDPAQVLTPSIPDALPDSEAQQAAIGQVRAHDAYNWGYDPFHYGVPEGSYSTQPQGSQRILEFREMVQSLAQSGLGTIMDVVYNHTHSAEAAPDSMLDKIVPGYYHRFDNAGQIQQSSCCPDTASEHQMMEKLMIDTLVRWAKEYKITGFRFDLMGHHTVDNLRHIRAALDKLTLAQDGIDGRKIYLYGEGWKFGSLDAIRPDAMNQANAAGTGVGTFNDRLRDSVRGGNFDHATRADQGLIDGLFLDPNHSPWTRDTPKSAAAQKDLLRNLSDNVRLGMAGNLLDFVFVHSDNQRRRGATLKYRGQEGAGYTLDPQENVNYVSAHDNYTLWDQIAAKAPYHTQYRQPYTATVQARAAMQQLALGIVLLGQGVPFIHAGSEILRSKSGDGDSYDSGDWFNALDWSYAQNGWGKGLPPAWRNQNEWDFWRPRLSDSDFRAGRPEILQTLAQFQRLLMIRRDSPLFRMRNEIQVQQRVRFLNANRGDQQVPGLIVMQLWDGVQDSNLDPRRQQILVVINPSPEAVSFADPVLGQPGWKPFQLNDGRSILESAVQPLGTEGERISPRPLAQFAANGQLQIPARSLSVFQIDDPPEHTNS